MLKHRPRQAASEAYLRRHLASVARPALPSIARCARDAGVSYVTMWKAFAALRERGELSVGDTRLPTTTPDGPRWRTVRTQLVRDIVSGRYAAGASLSLKEAAAEYGACYRTAVRALNFLEAQGWLVRDKRQFRVRSASTGGFGSTVVLLSTVDRSRSSATLSPRQQELIRACEIHCSRMRLGLEPVLLTRDSFAAVQSLKVPASTDVAGYLVWLGDVDAATLEAVLGRLAGTGKPVSVLDEVGEIAPENLPTSRADAAFFSMANSMSAGMAMGRHLLGLGHRSADFLLIRHRQPWADNRYAGVCEAFAAAGYTRAVRQFTAGHEGSGLDVGVPLRSALADPAVTAVVAENDRMGIACLAWLEQQGLRAGHDLSVAGFDDTPDAFMHNLTSYNFNCEATVHAMLAHLFGRRLPRRGRTRIEAVEVEGFVTQRRSTARAGRTPQDTAPP